MKEPKLVNAVNVLFLICCVLLSLLAQPVCAQSADSLLAARLDTLVANELPAGSVVGISVFDLTEGRTLYEHHADRLSRPASTMKVLTAITALSQSEADAPFRTEVWYRGRIERDTLKGDIYVVGGMDPEFDDEAMDSLVAAVARFPFSVVQGTVYGDVSMKDSLYWGNGWLWDDTPSAFQPYLSPLMLEKGTLTVTALPAAQAGDTARLLCTPVSTYYTLVNETKSRMPSAGPFRVTRNWLENGNRVTVTGNVPSAQARTINIFSSERFFMHVFTERLRQEGIHCNGYSFGELVRDSLSVRMTVHETPLQAVLDQMMKESDNLNAEAMLYRLGAQASGEKQVSAKAGLDAIRRLIRQLGLNPRRYKLADGCGLSHYNYITPELLVTFLKYAYSRTDIFQHLYKAMPVSGIDGTLKYRMGYGTPAFRCVHAKTGSYTGINCLAGYLKRQDGHWIAFAIMNQNVLSGRGARAFQDKVCLELVKSPAPDAR